jgi:RND family efflux transporter MFP subunit
VKDRDELEETDMKSVFAVLVALPVLLAGPLWAAEYRGLIEAHRVIKIGSPQAGVLATVEVDRGDIVKKGQVLATLKSELERAAMEVARYRAQMEGGIKAKEASLDFLGKKKDRVEHLHKKQLAAQADMDEAEANRLVAEMQVKDAVENKQLAELEYKRAAAALERTIIRSPVDGVIVERSLSPGEFVENEPILKMAEINPLNVEVIMPVAQLLSVKVGMHATVVPEAPVNGKYTAVVKIVDKVVDAASGTVGVRLELPNPGYRIPAGLKSKVTFPGK